ncbi:Uncharacterised protein [Klebsiella pneumoniae]|nr:Uncharacterised protein [Klebsiella pneumoniae]
MTIAESRAGDEGIFDMGFNTVRLIEDGGNPSLGVERRTFADRPFTQHGHRTVLSQAQGKGKTGSAAADNQHITREVRSGIHCLCLIY